MARSFCSVIPRCPAPQNDPQFRRYTAAELADMAIAPAPATKLSGQEAGLTGMAGGPSRDREVFRQPS